MVLAVVVLAFAAAIFVAIAVLVITIATIVIASAFSIVMMVMAATAMGLGDDFEVRAFRVEDGFGEIFGSPFIKIEENTIDVLRVCRIFFLDEIHAEGGAVSIVVVQDDANDVLIGFLDGGVEDGFSFRCDVHNEFLRINGSNCTQKEVARIAK